MRQEAFDAHPLWGSVTQLQDAIDKANERDEPEASEPLSAVRYLAATLKSHQGPADPAPYSKVTLDAINGTLPNVITEVNNYAANGNVTHLSNAETYTDQTFHQIGYLPASILRGGAAGQANKVFKEYREDAEEAISHLREKNAELRETLSAATTEFDTTVSGLKSEIAALTSKITQDETRLDQALTTNNEAFTAKQTEREEKFREFLDAQGESLKTLAEPDLQAIQKVREDAATVYQRIDDLREGTEKVAGLASSDILAGKFQEYAKEQWKWGLAANIVGFLTLVGGLAVLVWTLSHLGVDQKISWQYTTLKLGVTVTIIAASAVAFRLGAMFLERSGTSKRLELELRAIGPFFSDIDDPEALKEAKKAFVERSFGHGWGEKPSAGRTEDLDVGGVVQTLTETVRSLASRDS